MLSVLPFAASTLLLGALVLLRLDRCSISALASVVSDGSPGSSTFSIGESTDVLAAGPSGATLERVRGLFAGGLLASIEAAPFRCFVLRVGEAATSSPDASRDEGWSKSVVEDFKC